MTRQLESHEDVVGVAIPPDSLLTLYGEWIANSVGLIYQIWPHRAHVAFFYTPRGKAVKFASASRRAATAEAAALALSAHLAACRFYYDERILVWRDYPEVRCFHDSGIRFYRATCRFALVPDMDDTVFIASEGQRADDFEPDKSVIEKRRAAQGDAP